MVANPLLDRTRRGAGGQFSFDSKGEAGLLSLDLMRVTHRDNGDAATAEGKGTVDKSSKVVGWSLSAGSGRTMISARGGVQCCAGRNVPIPWVRASGDGNLDALKVPLSTVLSIDTTASHDVDTDPVVLIKTLAPELGSEVSVVIGQASEALRGLSGALCLEVSHSVSCLAKTSCCTVAGLGVLTSEERFDAGRFGVGDLECAPVLDVAAALTAAHACIHDVRCGRCVCIDAEWIATGHCLLRGARTIDSGSATI